MTATESTSLEFDQLPSALSSYLKVFRPVAGLKDGETVARIDAKATGIKIDLSHLQHYNKVCGYRDLDSVSPTFPHVLAAPLQMAALTCDAFPIKLLGLVHVKNVINQRRRIEPEEVLDLHIWLEGHRDVPAGKEFDLYAEVKAGGEVVWDSVTTFLRREAKGGKKKAKKVTQDNTFINASYQRFSLAADLGRRYAKVSGDYNLIHLYPMTAKLLGFKRHIAHGMWSLAKCTALLEDKLPEAMSLDVAFKLPAFLPTPALLKYEQDKNGAIQLRMLDGKSGEKPHLAGTFSPL